MQRYDRETENRRRGSPNTYQIIENKLERIKNDLNLAHLLLQ